MAKQYQVVRHFRHVDPQSGDVTLHEPGDIYTGPMETEEHYTGNDGPDGQGPLVLAKEVAEASKPKASSSDPTSGSSKEK